VSTTLTSRTPPTERAPSSPWCMRYDSGGRSGGRRRRSEAAGASSGGPRIGPISDHPTVLRGSAGRRCAVCTPTHSSTVRRGTPGGTRFLGNASITGRAPSSVLTLTAGAYFARPGAPPHLLASRAHQQGGRRCRSTLAPTPPSRRGLRDHPAAHREAGRRFGRALPHRHTVALPHRFGVQALVAVGRGRRAEHHREGARAATEAARPRRRARLALGDRPPGGHPGEPRGAPHRPAR
jgi:hypothetical protein